MKSVIATLLVRMRRDAGGRKDTRKSRDQATRTFSGASRCVWKLDSEA
jgi:hypothetical protein